MKRSAIVLSNDGVCAGHVRYVKTVVTFSMNSSSAGAWNSSSTAAYFSTSVKRLTARVWDLSILKPSINLTAKFACSAFSNSMNINLCRKGVMRRHNEKQFSKIIHERAADDGLTVVNQIRTVPFAHELALLVD